MPAEVAMNIVILCQLYMVFNRFSITLQNNFLLNYIYFILVSQSSSKIGIARQRTCNSDLERSWGQILGGADAVDQALLCFLLFSLLGDRGTVSGTCSGTASSDGDWRCK